MVRKAFEVQKKCSNKAIRLEITSILSIPEESERFLGIVGAENAFRIVKYNTNSAFWNGANYFSFLRITWKFTSEQRHR